MLYVNIHVTLLYHSLRLWDIVYLNFVETEATGLAKSISHLVRRAPLSETHMVSYFVQAVDGAGNVATGDNKGFYFEPVTYEIYLPLVLRGS